MTGGLKMHAMLSIKQLVWNMISMDYLGNMGYEIASPQSYLKLIPKQRNQEPA